MLCSFYNNLRQEGKLMDVEIQVSGVHFSAHKIILCKSSPYFGALFAGGWHQPDKREFNISGVSPDIMSLIIEYAYTDSVLVTKKNVMLLLDAADKFNVMGVVEACCDYLQHQLSLENCIGIWNLTDIFCCPRLKHKAYQYILHHFEEVCVSKQFLDLSLQQLVEIIEEDMLNVKKESTVFESVMRWISHSPSSRKAYISMLLSKIRLALMNEEYFRNNVKNNALVKKCDKCMSIINMYDLNTNRTFSSTSADSYVTHPRLSSSTLLAIGGWSGGSLSIMEAYDVRANCWTNVTNAWEPWAYHGIAVLDGFLYCIGGLNLSEFHNSVRKLDLVTYTWSQVGYMEHCRCFVSVAVLDGYIYAMGGSDRYQRHATAERYDPRTNQWSPIAPMHYRRGNASATALNGKVYICGGYNGQDFLATAEYYDPQTDTWTVISSMTTRRGGVGAIAYKDHIYAVGGYNGTQCLKTAEAYSPQSNTWKEVPSMMTPRSNFGIEILDDAIFVIGGYSASSNISKVERYDASTNEWRKTKDIEIARSATSCCVVYGLPNMDEYVAP